LVFEVRGLITGSEGNIPSDGPNFIGNLFFGSKGYMAVDVSGYQVYLGEKRELAKDVKFKEPKKWDTGPHMANFLAACRSRKHTDLNADIEEGYTSAALCHMANISYRMGRKLQFDPVKERFVNDAEANRLVSRDYRKPYVVPEKV
jgi:hypothetical protein